VPDPHRDTQWTSWDYALAEAVTAVDQLTSPSGHPRWLTEDPNVYWDIGESVDYSMQTLAKESEKYKDGVPPELQLFVKNPHKSSGEFWTLSEWMKWREENEPKLDRDVPEGSHAPTPDEYLEMQRIRQERIDAKYAEAADADALD
jgi:hypothetical protein